MIDGSWKKLIISVRHFFGSRSLVVFCRMSVDEFGARAFLYTLGHMLDMAQAERNPLL